MVKAMRAKPLTQKLECGSRVTGFQQFGAVWVSVSGVENVRFRVRV